MARYLVRLENDSEYTPKDARELAMKIRTLLGSKETIGNLRVSSQALEFDLFADDKTQLDTRLGLLKREISDLATLKLLDKAPLEMSKEEVVMEGFDLFNQERYWEAHEILEQAWQPATGTERNTVQGLILTAAALVHHQKDRDTVSLGMLERALSKLDEQEEYEGIDVGRLRKDLRDILGTKTPRVVRLERVSQAAS